MVLSPAPRRILVIGTTGSGKTALARQLSDLWQLPHAEQDAWNHQPGWQEAPLETFRAAVDNFTAQPAWIMDGNYSKARDIGWARADTVIWLDYPAWVVFWQLLRRTLKRMHRGEELWNGNREVWSSLLSRESILVWFFKTHWLHRRRTPGFVAEYPHLRLIRLRSRREAAALLQAARTPGASGTLAGVP
ncbi:adenylate kinase [Deinococcus irradiatisoli]|uniref:Adenylate kinase n=1 Tax=Deinococcus irradiatisoli TaxID=2202254 RepID=A0A2Z3JHZ0_9DEIO|nr:adenylate kinase [Deinococcus irradiatisoli]AWN24632.1 adenylate kinase [Deinococcus irradiatisoli]